MRVCAAAKELRANSLAAMNARSAARGDDVKMRNAACGAASGAAGAAGSAAASVVGSAAGNACGDAAGGAGDAGGFDDDMLPVGDSDAESNRAQSPEGPAIGFGAYEEDSDEGNNDASKGETVGGKDEAAGPLQSVFEAADAAMARWRAAAASGDAAAAAAVARESAERAVAAAVAANFAELTGASASGPPCSSWCPRFAGARRTRARAACAGLSCMLSLSTTSCACRATSTNISRPSSSRGTRSPS